VTLSFWPSILLLSLAQGAVVAAPRAGVIRSLRLPSGPRWSLVPAASVVGFVLIGRAAEHASAEALTYLALCGVPLLAALALGWLAVPARPPWALAVLPAFALAWAARGSLAGQAAALALTMLSCAALGAMIAAVTPPRWLAVGIVAMSVADAALVVAQLLQRPNNALNAAHPAAGLPRLQSAVLGSATMGYGDLFIAGALGALLAGELGRSVQLRAAALTALFAIAFDVLFLVVDELPATVPVALTLIALIIVRRGDLAFGRTPAEERPARGGSRASVRRRPAAT
jgi:hypothetical protein